jgi:hypothetical protein
VPAILEDSLVELDTEQVYSDIWNELDSLSEDRTPAAPSILSQLLSGQERLMEQQKELLNPPRSVIKRPPDLVRREV